MVYTRKNGNFIMKRNEFKLFVAVLAAVGVFSASLQAPPFGPQVQDPMPERTKEIAKGQYCPKDSVEFEKFLQHAEAYKSWWTRQAVKRRAAAAREANRSPEKIVLEGGVGSRMPTKEELNKDLLQAMHDLKEATENRTLFKTQREMLVEHIKNLLFVGAEPDQEGVQGYVPLHKAIQLGRFDVASTLLDGGADQNAVGPEGTPLHQAVSKASLQMVNLLIRYYADLTIEDHNGRTPVQLARDLKKNLEGDSKKTMIKIINRLENAAK